MNIIYNTLRSVAFMLFCASGAGGATRMIFVEIFNIAPSLVIVTIVNILGSFLLGIIASMNISAHYSIIWGIGFCGGFTSFSALSYLPFIDNSFNSFSIFFGYVYVNLMLALLCIWFGYAFFNKRTKEFRGEK